MGTTAVYALRYSELTDSPNGPTQLQNLALDVEAQFVRVDAAAAALHPVVDTQTAVGTTSSTTYTATLAGAGATACSAVFTAPPSGKVLIVNTAQIRVVTLGNSFCTIQVRAGGTVGSGSIFLAASDDEALIETIDGGLFRASVTSLVTGLTPASVYNVQQLFRIDNGSGTNETTRKKLIVLPQP